MHMSMQRHSAEMMSTSIMKEEKGDLRAGSLMLLANQ